MARTGAFTNWNTLSGSTTQAPSVTEAVNITMPDGLTVYNYASRAITYRNVAYTARLKSIGPIVTQLGNGQGRVTIRLHNGDLDFRDSVEGNYVTSAGSTVFTGMEDFSGALITVRRILTGTVSSVTTTTDLVYLFGRVTGSRYNEDYFELDCVTDVNLAPVLSNRRVGTKCAWVFKGTECGYSGGLTTCNKLYTDSGGCSGRSNQHRFGGFPVRDSAATIGKVTGLGSAATYQLVQSGTTYQEQRMITAFDDSFGVVDDSGNDRTVVTAITPDWINAQSTTYKASGSDTTTTGSITSGTATLTVASAVSWKVGQGIRIAGAGAAGAALTTTISAISGTTFTLAANASTTVSGAAVVHDDTSAIQTAINDGITNGRPVYIPKGTYRVTGLSVPGGATVIGDGPQLTIIKSVTNAVILDCPRATNDAGPYAYQGARIERIGVLGSITAGSSQIGIKCDDPVYALGHYLDDIRISDCGSHGLYIGNSFSSHFEKIFSTNCAGFNFKIYSPNMPCVTLHQCNTGSVRTSAPVGFMIVAGSIRLQSCNGIYGGAGTDWWGVVGGKANLYGETTNSTAYVQFVNCNFESNTVGGIRFLNNSRADFDGCAWVGDASASGSYKALLYDVDLIDRVSTTGSITSGTNSLTVASANSWSNGQGIKIAGAGAAGADLTTTITNISGSVFTLAANASTTVSGATITHTDDLFYPWEGPKGLIADNCLFTQSPITYYANSQPIHISAFPTTGNAYPPLQTIGQGPKMSGGTGFIASFYNDSAASTRPLIRADANAVKQVITSSTTFAVPGVRYIECNHTSPITVTLPWAASYSNIGQPIVIKDISSAGAGTNNITITSGGGGTVNGSSYVINQAKGAVTVIPDGSNDWRVVSEYRSSSIVPLIFPDGSTSSLAVQRSGDTDTGLFLDASGFYFVKDGTEYARIVGNDNQFKGVVRIKSSGIGQSYLTVDNEDLWIQFNNTLRWVMEKGGRLYPAGQNTQDLGYPSGGELRNGYFGTSLNLGISTSSQGQLIFRTTATGFTTTVEGGSNTGNVTFKLPVQNGTDGQYLRAYGNGLTNWFTPPYASETLNNLADPVAVNRGLQPGTDNTLDLGQNALSWASLYLKKDAFVGRHLQGGTLATPTLTRGDGAGTTWSATITGNQMCGYITFTTGSSPSSNATVFTMTFGTAFVGPSGATGWPIVNLIPCNLNAATLGTNSQLYPDHDSKSSTTAVFKIHSNALSANAEYRFYYMVMGTC